MLQITQNYKTGQLRLEEVPWPLLSSGGVLVRNAFSLISVGTERMKLEQAKLTLLGKAKARPDQVKKVIENIKQQGVLTTYRKVMGKLETLTPLGYSSAGIVVEVGEGVNEFQVGDRVACAGGGYANHAEIVFVPKNLCAKIPEGVGLDEAAFTTAGAIALQGVRQADVRLGEKVGVIGLGLLGQLTLQLLKASGCDVLGVDIDPWAVRIALENGADRVGVRGEDDVVQLAMELSDGYGLDVVIITAATKSNDPIELAEKLLRDRGRVVVVGMTKMDIPRNPYYIKELEVRLSRSYGPGRYDPEYEEHGHDYPIGYVRWTERRNMEAFLDLLAQKKISLDKIITHRLKFSGALRAYDLIQGKSDERYLGILLDYGVDEAAAQVLVKERIAIQTDQKRSQITSPKSQVGISFIGAGSFAKSMLLPHLKRNKDVVFRGILTTTGLSAKDVGTKFGFAFATSDPIHIIEDPETDLVMIATRHDTHAKYVIEALKKGKPVYVEKPLALNEQELGEIVETFNRSPSPRLMVGFNRRFSPMAKAVKSYFSGRTFPLIINIRINAGYIPPDHWTQDSEIGGGRIIGEACHFIDLARYWIDKPVVSVFAQALPDTTDKPHPPDTVSVVLKYSDGSIVNLLYLANGDSSIPKEYYEVFGGGKTAVLDDFRKIILAGRGKRKIKRATQDKGHKSEMVEVVRAIKEGKDFPIPFESLVETTKVTFAIMESIRNGNVVNLGSEEV